MLRKLYACGIQGGMYDWCTGYLEDRQSLSMIQIHVAEI